MVNKLKKILALSLALLSTSVFADNFNGKSAFGYTLGEQLNFEKEKTKDGVSNIKITRQENSILFSKKTDFHDFNQYYVASTPISKTIFKIGAMERTDNNEECMKERNNLISYFEDKYQSEHKKIPTRENHVIKDVVIGKDISVTVVCNVRTNNVVIEFSNLETSRLQSKESK